MENSGDSGDDGPLGSGNFLSGSGVATTYIGVQSDDLEDDLENTDDSNHGGGDPLHSGGSGGGGGPLREQDRFLPIANVAKIMKRAIPEAGKIAKDARECVQECVSEFISFITSEASDRCHMEKRKTINGEDILFAMTTLGFDNYVEPLKLYLQKYREATKGDNPPGGAATGNDAVSIVLIDC
ncbi:nuclear transcription factor Y subunit B-4 isoform X2 [Venturia canescens]|uniref:nuclear transcription factor Y subunit B-4 isoform X2 n=1 Tax=Venturia canescens TaxID=32260 RepID=UPI001C9BDA44|nr:nuclear transcription factor Y subunit B-4 isoform X2 [Venturia canescens]